jgi:DNA adenine methylase
MRSPLKWHGGKYYLASKIVALMPLHQHYVEPFAGGLSVLLAKDPEGVSEIANDIDKDLTNFWQCLRDEVTFLRFARFVEATPFSEVEYSLVDVVCAQHQIPCPDCAARFFIHVRQSLAGRMDGFASISKARLRRGMCEQVAAWLSSVEGLPAVHERLRRVAILNARPALAVIQEYDADGVMMYLDPPYLHETRASDDVYTNEMSEEQHVLLLATLLQCRSFIALSGYRSPLYDELLSSWTRLEFDLPNNAAGGAEKRRMTECVWVNWRMK